MMQGSHAEIGGCACAWEREKPHLAAAVTQSQGASRRVRRLVWEASGGSGAFLLRLDCLAGNPYLGLADSQRHKLLGRARA